MSKNIVAVRYAAKLLLYSDGMIGDGAGAGASAGAGAGAGAG